jgi:hypothetical protein
MAKSTKALLTGRIQMCKTNPSIAHIGLATHGRSIQIGSSFDTNILIYATTAGPTTERAERVSFSASFHVAIFIPEF